MNRLTTEHLAAVLGALVEGNSIASTCRMFSVNKVTVLRLLADAGTIAQKFHDATVTGLRCKRVQCDEIWAFCYSKEKNIPEKMEGVLGVGDVWTWTAICPDTKLMLQWLVGERTTDYATEFMGKLGTRLKCRIQITTDGHKSYPGAIRNALDAHVPTDYAQCVKLYHDSKGEGRYSPGECSGVEVKVMWGEPDRDHIGTSHVERSNLTMRMGIRRFTRLTNAFSKKLENHKHSVALFNFHYNFIRKHMTIKTTPAVAAGVADHVWTMEEFVRLIEREEEMLGGRITDYKPAATVKQKLHLMSRD